MSLQNLVPKINKILLVSLASFISGNLLFYLFDNILNLYFSVQFVFLILILQNTYFLLKLKIYDSNFESVAKFIVISLTGRFIDYLIFLKISNSFDFNENICFLLTLILSNIIKLMMIFISSNLYKK